MRIEARTEVSGHSGWPGRVRAATLLATAALVATTCAVTGSAGAAAPRWVVRPVPAVRNFPARSVSCSALGCVVLATECAPGGCGGLAPAAPLSTVNGGASWKKGTFPSVLGAPEPVSCGSPTVCVAVATQGPLGPNQHSAIAVTSNGGASWSNHVEPRYDLNAAACATATACVALGVKIQGGNTGEVNAGLVTANGGRSWTPIAFPARKLFLEGMTCTAPATCLAVGTNTTETSGLIYRSANAGRSWAPAPLSSRAKGMHTVSCTGTVCIATSTGYQVAISHNGGRSWALHQLPLTPTIQDAACMSGQVCVMVGFSASAPERPSAELTHNGGASWATQALPSFNGSLSSVSCLPTYCVAAGVRVVYSGSTATAEFPEILTY